MKRQTTRRDFLRDSLKTAAITGVGYWVLAGQTPKVSASPNERLAFAGIGIGGKGAGDIANAARFADVVAVCDVDKGRLDHAAKKYPKAKAYTDFRKLFEEQEKSIDAATISTADHTHAPAGLMAMRMKKHVYVQKPLTRTIYEARLMGKVAQEMGVCTQMGNQGSASDGLRHHAAEMKAGIYGDITEIHVWTNRPIWPQGPELVRTLKGYEERLKSENVPDAEQKVVEMKSRIERDLNNVEWELWLGPAKPREYYPGLYHAFAWRGWWDFGTGALGDIACHSLNKFMAALDLSSPKSVIAKTSGHDFDVYPKSSQIEFEYPDTATRKGFKFVWYDGGWFPDRKFLEENGFKYPEKMPEGGEVIIGTEGVQGLGRNERKQGVTLPEIRYAPHFPDAEGKPAEKQHDDPRNMFELITAVKENNPDLCFSNFPKQAGPLTEAMLLGNLAVWTAAKANEWGEKIYWDAANMKITNLAELKTSGVAELIKPVYREGYVLD
ncbi:MAG: Gfo/Idh/MocA family oxidoreductase [Planctomycetaceae bacterium]|jgi:predicted dehydrogenase|nr:Gfo/Idh/MocA family oxidoreductase [Planctomycetaceae bacterium]